MNQSREICLRRGSRRYIIASQREVANDRFIGSIDGRPVAVADSPEAVLAEMIRRDQLVTASDALRLGAK